MRVAFVADPLESLDPSVDTTIGLMHAADNRGAEVWVTEAGQPNEICHIWAYRDLNHRAQVRAEAVRDPEWQAFLKESAPLLEELHSTIMLPAPHSPMQ